MHAHADMRAVGEGDVEPRVLAPHVESVGVGEDARIAVGAGDRDGHELPSADRGSREADVAGGVAVDHCGCRFETQRLLDRVGE